MLCYKVRGVFFNKFILMQRFKVFLPVSILLVTEVLFPFAPM